jgi:hypothetical protein
MEHMYSANFHGGHHGGNHGNGSPCPLSAVPEVGSSMFASQLLSANTSQMPSENQMQSVRSPASEANSAGQNRNSPGAQISVNSPGGVQSLILNSPGAQSLNSPGGASGGASALNNNGPPLNNSGNNTGNNTGNNPAGDSYRIPAMHDISVDPYENDPTYDANFGPTLPLNNTGIDSYPAVDADSESGNNPYSLPRVEAMPVR